MGVGGWQSRDQFLVCLLLCTFSTYYSRQCICYPWCSTARQQLIWLRTCFCPSATQQQAMLYRAEFSSPSLAQLYSFGDPANRITPLPGSCRGEVHSGGGLVRGSGMRGGRRLQAAQGHSHRSLPVLANAR